MRGVGLMWGAEIVKDKKTRLAFDPKLKIGQELSNICFSHGLNTRPLGGHTMAFTPPLIISDAEINLGLEIFAKSLDELLDSLRSKNMLN